MHVAIILDGNGRWAERRGLPRAAGHVAGVEAVRRVVGAARGLGVDVLTLYAFSSDNWSRADGEVRSLLEVIEGWLRGSWSDCAALGVRVQVIGRRDRLPERLLEAVRVAEGATGEATGMRLRLAIDYSSREAILRAVRLAGEAGDGDLDPGAFDALLAKASQDSEPVPPVDLLVRTGGERRLSDFLLWESAYAELCFVERCWPEFTGADLETALRDFASRERRFGGIPNAG